MYVFFFKQKTAYEMRISDWSSDVCSSDLPLHGPAPPAEASAECLAARAGRYDKDRRRRSSPLPHPAQGPPTPPLQSSEVCRILSALQIGRASCRERVCQYV